MAIATTTTYGLTPGTAGAGGSVRGDGSANVTRRVTSTSASAPTPPTDRVAERKRSSLPKFVRLPTIGATSELIELGLEVDGSLQVPEDFSVAGWYVGGVVPGEPGPAIIAGHLDSYVGPGIFSKLGLMKVGDPINVTREDGSVVQFTTTRIDQYPKKLFPSELVYGETKDAEIRLITCGGKFNRINGAYTDNIVVYGKLLPNP